MDEFLEAGERITNIQRMVNVKYGISRKDDTLPERMFVPAKEGGRAGKAPNETSFAEALDRYYELRGWDKDGKPTASTLSRLKIQL
jgi:aldehyde:ferredoxin oxidoreductase